MPLFLRNVLACELLMLGVFHGAAPARSQTADSFDPEPDHAVYAMAVQPDGGVILGGSFTVLGGQSRNYLGRVDANGGLDLNFNPGTDRTVSCLAVQPDGRILVGGYFSQVAGVARGFLARLQPDGSLDVNFNAGLNGTAFCLVIQPDGKILVGGAFTSVSGTTCNRLVRLNPDGNVDSSFHSDFNGEVYSLALQTNGMIVAGGYFTVVSGQTRNHICRLYPDGTLDPGFSASADNSVDSVTLQPDGGILVVGNFATLNGQQRYYISRLNADGTLDIGFNPDSNGGGVCVALQADGRIILGGIFTTLCGQPCNNVGRLNPDGSLDPTFNPGADDIVMSLMLQADGKLLVGGDFANLGGQQRHCLGRLNTTDAATQSLIFDGDTAAWQRGGTAPEISWASFEACTNGTSWFGFVPGQHIAGGWGASLAGVPVGATIRARGFVNGGTGAGSTWFVETSTGPPAISLQPLSRTNNAGDRTSFSVVAAGNGPITYQWCKDGNFLSDTAQIAGTHSPTLVLSNVLARDAAAYSAVIANGGNSLTSQVATLTVVDPCIVGPPVSQAANPGDSASFVVTAAGTPNLYYQWRKAGQVIPGATTATLSLTNVQRADATLYDVVVTNYSGSVTSSVCCLMVNEVTADSLDPGADYLVSTLSVQLDGKILVGGRFSSLGGSPRSALARLNADGTLDTAFTASATAQYFQEVNCFALQPGGTIVVGGLFTALNGQARTNLGRLKSDGTLDAGFKVPVDSTVRCLAVQTDGRILVGGSFTNVAGARHLRLARLSADGIVDSSFNPVVNADSYPSTGVSALAVQMDGKILVGGSFTNLCGQTRWSLGRLNADGTLDTGFFADALPGTVYSLALQADGKILVGGQFRMALR